MKHGTRYMEQGTRYMKHGTRCQVKNVRANNNYSPLLILTSKQGMIVLSEIPEKESDISGKQFLPLGIVSDYIELKAKLPLCMQACTLALIRT
jgi:hypothetical protein